MLNQNVLIVCQEADDDGSDDDNSDEDVDDTMVSLTDLYCHFIAVVESSVY